MVQADRHNNKPVCIIRRNYRVDGGAEVATSNYINAISQFTNVTLACENWEGPRSDEQIVQFESAGRTRAATYRHFVETARKFVSTFEGLSHAHELVSGVDVIRLGDGLHRSWLEAAGWSWKALLDPFHRYKLGLEEDVLTDPRLKLIIVNSDFVGKDVVTRFGIHSSKLLLIRNIVRDEFRELPLNQPSKRSKRLVFIGSGWQRKGLGAAIRALGLLSKDVTLSIYGADRSEQKYKRLVSRLGLQERVFFRGIKKIMPEDLDSYDALVHPAIYEPFPNVAIEALSRGLAVVSTEGSGTSDFSEEQGVATCSQSDASIAEGIRWALDLSPDERNQFRDHIVQFDSTYLQKALKKAYQFSN